MIDNLKIKCENLMTFIPSNLYVHGNQNEETLSFSNLTIPTFLSHYVEESIERLMKEKESLDLYPPQNNKVYYYIDPFKMCYLTWPLSDAYNQHYTITLGPIITEHLTTEEVRYLGYKMKLSTDNCFILENFYGIVPYYDQLQMARIASVFLDYLAIDPHLPQIIKEDHSVLFPKEVTNLENKFKSFDFIEENYAAEDLMLKFIQSGDVESIKAIMLENENIMVIPPRYPSDPLRELKNLAITLNSISVRTAQKGGLSYSISHNLSHNFAVKIENQTTTNALSQLSYEMIITYADSVRKYALKGYSELIVKAINYIRTHLVTNISLHEIATDLHISKEHLSRKFKKETGLTPTDFIHKTKIEESCNLLTSKVYSISDISYTFGYSSPAHYTKMFKKYMHVTPKQWQQQKLSPK